MNPDLVADIGNSRIKWGRCVPGAVAELASLDPEDCQAWQQQLLAWNHEGTNRWVVAGVHPGRRDRLVQWISERGDDVAVVDSWQQVPVSLSVAHKDRVGIDRLLNAVAAKRSIERGTDALIVSAGTAVTVDWIDGTGTFRGGAILPGLRLMAQALHDYTAQLPLVQIPASTTPQSPGTSTETAIQAGIFWAVVGGIRALLQELSKQATSQPAIFLTGGDVPLLEAVLEPRPRLWPEMTLEGLRLTAETLP